MQILETLLRGNRIGKSAVLAVMLDDPQAAAGAVDDVIRARGFRMVRGRVGTMEPAKVVAAVETAARRSGLVDETSFREEHALYHAIIEALQGVSRGQIEFGSVLRTVGLSFVVLRGSKSEVDPQEGEWLAVALYGTIGAPVKGWEHEAFGLGLNHV